MLDHVIGRERYLLIFDWLDFLTGATLTSWQGSIFIYVSVLYFKS
jgi:hypothetical protein